ncbi:MaoC family dehydratase [Paracoccus sp. (in: a-proteobacteria)]|uniref:MaoC family dehydratase n=1 Tax=Paracoccus sp. TaxID=267 RepID=UPI00321FB989
MTAVKYYDDLRSGDRGVTPEITVTREMIQRFADLTGDHTPVHVDEEYAAASHFGAIVAHGLFGLALADGLKTRADLQFPPGASLGWNWDFLRPVLVDDRLHCVFHIGEMRRTRKPGWGILHLEGELINQRGEVVQKGTHKLMIPCRPETAKAAP